MKILYIITKSNFGGAQKYIYELAVAAKERGYEVVVAGGGTGAAGAAAGPLFDKLAAASIPTCFLPAFGRDMALFSDLAAVIATWRLIRTERPDVLHVTSSKAGGIGSLVGRLAGVPRIIFTSHGLTMDESWRPRWQRTLIAFGTWLTLRLAHHSIMITSDTTRRAQRLFGLQKRVSHIANGIRPTTLNTPAAARAATGLTIPQGSYWLGGVGELHPNKNWAAAIRALSILPTNIHFVLVGAGEEDAALRALTAELDLKTRVHFLGYRNAAELLPAFDLFLLPSKKEGLPYVLLEAGLANIPVIASNLSGNRDIITDGKTGRLIDPTPQNIATAVAAWQDAPQAAAACATALHHHVSRTFAMETMLDRTFALYSTNNSAD